MKVFLASKSPRRRQLLKYIVKDFDIVVADIEELIDDKFDVSSSVMSISWRKAVKAFDTIKDLEEDFIIISADTVVYLDDVLVKPDSKDDARRMINALNGKWHKVYTGFSVLSSDGSIKLTDVDVTSVKFKELSVREIEDYISTDEPYDKAGSYAIQGIGAKFIERIEGDYYSVMGLPICKLNKYIEPLVTDDE